MDMINDLFKQIWFEILFMFYILPTYLSIFDFTILKLEDINAKEKHYTKNKFTYFKSIMLSFVPGLNIIFVFHFLKSALFSIKKGS